MMAVGIEQPVLVTWRCHSCKRIIARMVLVAGSTIEIKCKCNTVNTLQAAR